MKTPKNWQVKDWILTLIPVFGNLFPLTLLSIQKNLQTEGDYVIFIFGIFCFLLMTAILTAICSYFHSAPVLLFFIYSLSLILTVTVYAGIVNALIIWVGFSLVYLACLGLARLLQKRSQN
ncbi:MAG: hypothetical protein ACRC6H_07815 [Culicoidibacterales bacterium]